MLIIISLSDIIRRNFNIEYNFLVARYSVANSVFVRYHTVVPSCDLWAYK